MDTLKTAQQEITELKSPKLFSTEEGKVLLLGIILTFLIIAIIAYYGFTEPFKAKVLSLVFVTHAFGGRAAGVGICIVNDLKFFPTVIYNFILEIQLVCLIFSIFVLSITNYIKLKSALRIANKMRQNADKHKDKIRQYGWIGLFLFVMAPLPGTGPVAGSILGYLLKMRLWYNFSAVFSGTFSAILMWVVCFDFLKQYLFIIQYIIASIIFVVVFLHFQTIRSWFAKQD